jgi:MFS family permease
VSNESETNKRRSVLRHPDFAWFWASSLVSNTGMWMSNLTMPVVLYQITGSALWVGIFSVANFVPSILLTPLGGVWADRYDRRVLMMLTQLGMGVAGAGLWLMVLSGVDDPVLLLLPVMINGAFGGLNGPSFMAFINDLVPRDELRAAVTINSIQFNIARAFGPLVAGFLLVTTGPAWALFVNFLTYLLVVVVLLFIRARNPQILVKTQSRMLSEMRRAASYMRNQRGIMLAIYAGIVGAIFGQPLYALTVVLAHTVYHVDEFKLGAINALLSLGAILSIPLLSGRARRFPLSRAVAWGLIGSATGLIALSVIPSYELALPVFIFTGAALILVMAGTNTVIQLIVRNDLRGRVLALRQISFMSGIPIGAVLGGWFSDAVGVQPYLMWTGITVVVITIAMKYLPARGFASLDDPHDTTQPSGSTVVAAPSS